MRHIKLISIALAGLACVCAAEPRAVRVPASDTEGLLRAVENAQPGDAIQLEPGTYQITPTIKCASSGTEGMPIRIETSGSQRAVLDFSAQAFGSANRGIEIRGDWWHIVGIEVASAGDNGINITGSHNIIEKVSVHECGDSGIQLSEPASHNLVVDCESYRNVDPPNHGENADGFAAKFKIGPGNVFRNCRAWENSDDGWDLWRAPVPVRIENCIAWRNGINLWNIDGYSGDGNGFKLGGDHIPAEHVVVGCIAFDQPHRGFDQNNNTAGLTIENCTAIRCEYGFYLPATPQTGKHVLRNNVAIDSMIRIEGSAAQEGNRWITTPTTRPSN